MCVTQLHGAVSRDCHFSKPYEKKIFKTVEDLLFVNITKEKSLDGQNS